MPTEADLESFLARLSEIPLSEVREEWRRVGLGPPPQVRSVDLLRRLIAWRVQAELFGGLSVEARRQLRASSRTQRQVLPCGLRLAREWRGRRYDVEIVSDGVLFSGHIYSSLSEVAREITGVRWNGPRFFGLRGNA